MRTLKKALALVVVLAMALGTVATAVQYQDVAEDYDYAQAIDLLSGLGVLQGDESGFRPEATITRAESCAVIYRMLSGNTYANNYAGATDFSDVTGSHWASGYINYCSAFEIVTGYPDGTFKPDAPVTFGEFVTMVVRALGCDKDQEGDSKNLTFPTGYMGVADQQGVLDSSMTLNADAAAFRGLVAQVAYNAIFNADYMRAGYTFGYGVYYPTIAEKVFSMVEDTGVVLAYGDYDFTNAGTDDEEVAIAVSGDYNYTGEVDDVAKLDCSSLDVTKYLFRSVTFWTDGDEVFAYSLSEDNTEVNANAADVSYDDDAEEVTVNDVDYECDDIDYFCVNYDPELTDVIDDYMVNPPVDGNYAVVYTGISNDGDDDSLEAVIALVYSLADVTLVDDDVMELTVDGIDDTSYINGLTDAALNLSDDSDYTLIDGESFEFDPADVAFTDLVPEEDDTIMFIYYPLNNDGDGELEAYKVDEVTGKYSSYKSSTGAYTIGGSKYYFVENDASFDFAINDSVEASQLPIFGYIYGADSESTDSDTQDIYLVTKMGVEESGRYGTEDTYYMTAWNTKGEEVEFEVDADAVVAANGVTSAAFSTAVEALANYNVGLVLKSAFSTAFNVQSLNKNPVTATPDLETQDYDYKDAGEYAPMFLANLSFDDGVVDEITSVDKAFTLADGSDDGITGGAEVDKYSKTSGLLYLDDSTKNLIKSDSASFFWDTVDDEAAVYYGTFPSDADNEQLVSYYDAAASYHTIVASLYLGEASDANTDTDTCFGILLDGDVYGNPDDDDEAYIELTIATNGKIATYTTEMGDVADVEHLYNYHLAFVGDGDQDCDDAVVYFELNSDGDIVLNDTIDNTFRAASAYNGLSTVSPDDIVAYGTIESIGDGLIAIVGGGEGSYAGEYEIASDVNVYSTKASSASKNWSDTTIGTLSSVKADSTSYARTAVIILSEGQNTSDKNDAEVIDIFFFQRPISAT